MQSCWAEDPNVRPDFAQVVRMLTSFLSSISVAEKIPPQIQIVAKSFPAPKEMSDSSTLGKDETITSSNPDVLGKSRIGLFDCFRYCI